MWSQQSKVSIKIHSTPHVESQHIPLIHEEKVYFPLSPFHHHYPDDAHIKEKIKNSMIANWVKSFKKTDKLAILSGYLPLSFHKMLKFFQSKTYRSIEDQIRLLFLFAARDAFIHYNLLTRVPGK